MHSQLFKISECVGGLANPNGLSVTLKDSEGHYKVIKRTLAQIVFESSGGFTLDETYDFESETRLRSELPPIRGPIEDRQAVEEQVGRPTFTVVETSSYPRIAMQLVTKDHLYWFKEDKFGELKNRQLSISAEADSVEQPGTAVLNIFQQYDKWGEPTGNSDFCLELYLQERLFERLFQAIAISRGPCHIRGFVKVVCFQEGPRYNPYGDPQTLIFPCDTARAMLGSIALARFGAGDS